MLCSSTPSTPPPLSLSLPLSLLLYYAMVYSLYPYPPPPLHSTPSITLIFSFFNQSIDCSFVVTLGERDEAGNTLCPEDLKGMARMGLVRCNLRLANTREGLKQANEINDVQLFAECAEILELQKQFSEAAAMYIKGEKFEQAADIYTKHLIKLDKNKIAEAAAIMDRVQNDQVCLSTLFVNTPNQHTQSTSSINTLYQYCQSTHPIIASLTPPPPPSPCSDQHQFRQSLHDLSPLIHTRPPLTPLTPPLTPLPSLDQHQFRQSLHDLRALPGGRQSLPARQ